MKILGKFLLGLLAFLSFLLLVLIAVLLFIWFRPETIVNEPNIKKALTYAPPELKASWSSLQINFAPLGFTGKTVDIRGENICFSWEPLVSTCLPQIKIHFSFLVNRLVPRLTQIEELTVQGDFLKLNLGESNNKKISSPLPDLRLPAFKEIFPAQLDLKKLGIIQVSMEDVTILQKEGDAIHAKVSLSRTDTNADNISFSVKGEAQAAQGTSATIDSHFLIFGPEKIEGKGLLLAKTSAISTRLPFSFAWDSQLVLKAHPDIKTKQLRVSLPAEIQWDKKRLDLRTGPYENTKTWAKGKIGVRDCALISRFHPRKGYPESNEISCAVLIWPKAKIQGLTVIETLLKGEVKVSSLSSNNIELAATTSLTGENAFIVARADVRGDFYFDVAKKDFLEKSNGDFKLSLKIPEFQVWKNVFEQSLFAIPAPLHILKGSIDLQAEGQLPGWQDQLYGTAKLKTNLAEGRQKLLSTTDVRFKLLGTLPKPTGIDVELDADITDVRLEAPPLRLESPPQILPDGRFVLKKNLKPKAVRKFNVIWKLKAKTGQPLQIISNLLPEPVPIALNITAGSNQKMDGTIEVRSFPFEVFRKKARVDNIRLTFYRNATAAELNGLVLYSNPEVDIRILILGSTNQPRIEFESEPPLNRQQIISVLLFNKSLDELTEEEVNSTASMSRALSDGAFGLFSLFFLSSTPIQSISYDPVEQAYTARVKLDDSTTLSLGSDFSEGRQFTVRRRLGGPWSVRTELRQEENRPDVVLTLLEWLRRF